MPGFEERAVCRAPAEEVWKLLYDPARFAEWWDGWERVEPGDGGAVTRYDRRWPEFAYPANVTTRREEGRVVVSCQLSDIVHEWVIEPSAGGCALLVRVEVPEEEAARLEDQRRDVRSSLARLVARAEG
jgi:uncharacterized protein YndB with AHSA1/START domain